MKFEIVFSMCLLLFYTSSRAADEVELAAPAIAVAETQPTIVAEKSEDLIPINIAKEKKSESAENSNGRMLMTFGLLAVVLGVGYFYAKKYGRPTNSKQTKIKILTQHYLGPKKSLAIVRVAGESILIGVTDQNINMIKSLSLLDDEIPESLSTTSFQETLSANEKNEVVPAGGEEFSIRHIKDVVSLKLKGMRSEI